MSVKSAYSSPDKTRCAVCGLFCASCTFFIASTEDPARLEALASRLNLTTAQIECHGCRSDKLGIYCEKVCTFKKCAGKKGLDFCGQCSDYPCTELKDFQSKMPHRLELWESLERINKVGWGKWYMEMVGHFSCPECGTINSAYDMSCRKCGHKPSCNYVEINQSEIIQLSKKLMI